jgi:maltose phosphorylase
MAKIADKYFETLPWKVVERGFDPKYSQVAESIFSLGNEYMGVRGYFEEGYSGETLQGSYFNGIYEMTEPDYSHYKGIVDFMEFMVNSVDWLYTRINVNGENLDLAKSEFSDFERELDLKTGELKRSFIWHTKSGKIKVVFERILSMTEVSFGVQKITFESIDFNGDINVISGLDFTIIHQTNRKNFWVENNKGVNKGNSQIGEMYIEAATSQTGKKVYSKAIVSGDGVYEGELLEDKKVALNIKVPLISGQIKSLTKVVENVTFRDGVTQDEYDRQVRNRNIEKVSFDGVLSQATEYWQNVWHKSDIEIDGDLDNQQGVRFCIFQMYQTYHGAVEGTNIGAKGLTGEAYNGNAFWDTETCCLPFFIFNNKDGARNLLYFRYKTLDEARNRAKMLDCKGAFYPIATISGKECCNLWQHASLQLQASTAVAYGIWFYEKMFSDVEFLEKYGLEMLIEISRMLVTRGDYDKDGKYGYYCVMGPDEFQMMVHNNTYTNYMAKFTLNYTLTVINQIKEANPQAYKKTVKKVNYSEKEAEEFKNVADNMLLLYDEETKLFEQHYGFYKLPHVDKDAIPISEFPLYDHWSYERIYRNDMIKQPDVLMFMFLFNSSFTLEQLKANYEYYEPLCIHESSLSPSIHSVLATQLGKDEEAYEFFRFATRMDLDNYNRNTNQGLHTTSIAAAWMNIVYGFGGLRSDGDILTIKPSIPAQWNSYSFTIEYAGQILKIKVEKDKVTITPKRNNKISIRVYEQVVEIADKEYSCTLKQ